VRVEHVNHTGRLSNSIYVIPSCIMASVFLSLLHVSEIVALSYMLKPVHFGMPRGIPIQPLYALNFDMLTLPPASMLVVGYARIIGFVSQGVGLFEVFK
jgi:hypothetical protein